MQVFYIGMDKCLMKAGNSQTDAQFYRFDDVRDYMGDIKVGDTVEVSYDLRQDGKYKNKFITFIKKAGGSAPSTGGTTAPVYNKPYSPPATVDSRQNSIERQCAMKTAAEIVSACQGQFNINDVDELLEKYFNLALTKIRG